MDSRYPDGVPNDEGDEAAGSSNSPSLVNGEAGVGPEITVRVKEDTIIEPTPVQVVEEKLREEDENDDEDKVIMKYALQCGTITK